MNVIQKIASYFYPIKIHQMPSERSGALEVTLVNGKLVIDSENANYSYGSLQKVLKKGLLQFDAEKLQQCKNILILGVAGGSIIETLQADFKLKDAQITGVEIDKEVLTLANTYFKINKKPNVKLVCEDAFEFVKTTNQTYDLIVIDIFNDSKMPTSLFDYSFWNKIHNTLPNNGLCLFNSISTSNNCIERNNKLFKQIQPKFTQVTRKKTAINELFVLVK